MDNMTTRKTSISQPICPRPLPKPTSTITITATKSFKPHNFDVNSQSMDSTTEVELIPGLPNHLALFCLSRVHPSLLYPVCHSWRRLIYSPSFPPFFSLYALLSPKSASNTPLSSARNQGQELLNSIEFWSLDPISSAWKPLPSPPVVPPLRLLRHHPSFISRKLPIQSVSLCDRLVLIAATNDHFLPALTCPLVFDPFSSQWFSGPPLPTPRRWCATGSVQGAVYLASGIGSCYQQDVARSVEKWEMKKKKKIEWSWEKMTGLKDGQFSREACEAVGYKGKLCMVNMKGNILKKGAVYHIATDQWEEMPSGMLTGWNGPAAADNENMMYAVNEAKGALSKYDPVNDHWEELIESSECLKGAEQIAAGRGRVCAICAGGERVVVVDVVASPTRIWTVNPPVEMEVVSVHILPRMSLPKCPMKMSI